jgi:glycosyltransferase involved in cell wall biosynthesis
MKSKKQRLLFVVPNLLGGGAQLILLHLLKYLSRDKYEIGLFIFRNDGEKHYFAAIPNDVTVEFVYDRDDVRIRARYEFARIFFRLVKCLFRYDIVIGSLELTPTFLSYFAARLLGKRCVGWVHIAIEPYLTYCNFSMFNKLTQYVYPRLNAVVFVSEGASVSMKSYLGSQEINNGMTIYNVLDYPSLEMCENSVGWNAESKTIVAAGRLVPQKGFDVLIKAHAKLIKRSFDHKLIILGDGNLRDELQELARGLGVSDSVVFEGYVVDPSVYFKNATVFVLSSRFEGLGMVILEAMMAGAPVVATDCPYGPAEILENGKYGILVPPEDVNALAAAIERLLLDSGLRDLLKKSGPQRAADFLPDKIIPQWESLFESL